MSKRLQSPHDDRPNEDDDKHGQPDDTMFDIKALTGAVGRLTAAVTGLGEQFRAGLATKADVLASEERILKALGERISPESLTALTSEIKSSDDNLASAVASAPK